MAASTQFVKSVWKNFLANKGHDATCLSALKILSAHPSGSIRARLPITQSNVNRLSTVHGGLISTLVDTCGSLSISAKGFWVTGVSTNIHVNFLRSAGTPGAEIIVEANVDSIGRNLAYTSVILKNPESGKFLAQGSHTKFIATAYDHPKNVKFDSTGDDIVEGTMPS